MIYKKRWTGLEFMLELADLYQVLLVLPLLKKEQEYPFEETAKKIEIAIEYTTKSKLKMQLTELPVFDEVISMPSYIMKELEETTMQSGFHMKMQLER